MNHSEKVLYSHLTNVDSLDVLSEEGFNTPASREVIPTEIGRELVAWVLDYYWINGRKVAPSKAAIMETWGDELEAGSIAIEDEEETDSVEWAIAELRSDFARVMVQRFAKEFVTAIANASGPDRVALVQDGAHSLHLLSQQLTSRKAESLAGVGFEDVLARHEAIRLSGGTISGLTFGLPIIDEYTFGIHDGELCVFAAPTGVGKSWMAAKILLAEWKAGRRCVLVTLENDLPMTFDRLACIEAGVDYEKLQRGALDQGSLDRIAAIQKKLEDDPKQPIVTMLTKGMRDPASIVRAALSKGAESLIIDQLDFVEKPEDSKAREEPQRLGDIMHALKVEISEGKEKLPCVLLHQVNRSGVEAAEKTGRFKATHMAGSSQVEKTADFLFAFYQSEDQKAVEMGEIQDLKFRRGKPGKRWEAWLRFGVGDIRIIREITDEDEGDE